MAVSKLPEGSFRFPLITSTHSQEKHMKAHYSLVSTALLLFACRQEPSVERYPLRSDLAHYGRIVTTENEQAQKYFDQGLVLLYGFHHEAAIKSFQEAVSLDEQVAMGWWGQAFAAGPNINNPAMDSAASKAAYDAVLRAASLASHSSPVEQALIGAIAKRYAWPQPEDRKALDIAYAEAMREVWKQFPNDPDDGALFADALMNLRPWDLWSTDGSPRAETPEIVATLEKVMQMVPDHPGANHFYLHTMEASPTPQKADKAADVLRDRIPGAGHLVHMPSHIDIRTGRYEKAILANQRGASVDSTWASEGGFYSFYRAHNYHVLAYAAMFDGQREIALKAARDMVKQVPLEVVREYIDFLDGFIAAPVHVMVRFGMWEEMLQEPRPPADLLATTAFWRYGRTVAYAATGDVKAASLELDSLRQAYELTPESRTIGNNPARKILEVGLPVAEGELQYRRGNHKKAYALLRTAVQRDDSLRYDEPWGWMMPVRHSLGALLLEQGRIADAEQVYRDDLRLHPENGWALKGLAECLHRKGSGKEAEEVDKRFEEVWARADIQIKGSCYCRTKFEM